MGIRATARYRPSMRASTVISLCLLTLASPASAAEASPSTEAQPVCTDRAEIGEYIKAIIKRDTEWMGALKTCHIVPAGIKVVVVEDYPSRTRGTHEAKVRVITGDDSFVGYTMIVE